MGSGNTISPLVRVEEETWSRAKIAWPYMALYPIRSEILVTKHARQLRHERVSATSILYRAPEQLVHMDLTKLREDQELTYHDLVSTMTDKNLAKLSKPTLSHHSQIQHKNSVLRRLIHHSGDISTSRYSKAADVFSSSMIAVELLTNRSPWQEIHGINHVQTNTRLEPRDLDEIRRGICSGRRPRREGHVKPSRSASDEAKRAISIMRRVISHGWRQRPEDRPSSRKLLGFFK